MTDKIHIYTDGACRGNPGPGGWGVVLKYQQHEKTASGAEPFTTNNRMELTATISGLELLKSSERDVVIYTDSQYVRNGITQWIHGWKRNGWKTKDKSYVKNIDLWKKLDGLIRKYNVKWEWIKGHNGHRENEMADTLATSAIDIFFKSLNIHQEPRQANLFDN
ncbi:MAG: ribonuclease HI [Chlamydiota bacterium]|nr:ribonuclease HI [Chlamydiota bacterium]